jgi:hypothetical protein
MTWGLVGMAAVSVVSGVAGASSANSAALKNQVYGSQQEVAQWDKNTADNKTLADTNLSNAIRTGFKVGLLNVQKAQAKKAALQAGVNLSRNGQQALASATANAAAAGSVGSSVDAVISDIHVRLDESAAQMDADYDVQSANFDTQLYDILMSGQDAQNTGNKISVASTPDASTTGLGQVLLGAAVQVGGSYFSSQMSLGLGKK